MPSPRYRFYYDQDCGFCVFSMKIARGLDFFARVEFLPIQSRNADPDLGHLSDEERFANSHFVDGHRRVPAGEGVLELFSQLPLVAPWVFLLRLIPGHRKVVERLYAWVAENRFRLMPGATCEFRPSQSEVELPGSEPG